MDLAFYPRCGHKDDGPTADVAKYFAEYDHPFAGNSAANIALLFDDNFVAGNVTLELAVNLDLALARYRYLLASNLEATVIDYYSELTRHDACPSHKRKRRCANA